MDQVTTLFLDFREHHISYDQLYQTLLEKICQDPSFCHQVIQILDQVQQKSPIPITYYIELRTQLVSDVDSRSTLPISEASQLPKGSTGNNVGNSTDDPDATVITPLPTDTNLPNAMVSSSDPTLLSTLSSASQAEGEEDATVIMSPGTIGTQPHDDSEDETLITTVTTATTTNASTAQPNSEETSSDAPTLIGSHATLAPLAQEKPLVQENPAVGNKPLAGEEPLAGEKTITDENLQAKNQVDDEAPTTLNQPPANTSQVPKHSSDNRQKKLIFAGTSLVVLLALTIVFSFFITQEKSHQNIQTNQPIEPNTLSEESWGDTPAILQPPVTVAEVPPMKTTTSQPAPSQTNSPPQKEQEVTQDLKPSVELEPTISVIQQAAEEITFQTIEEEANYLFDRIIAQEKTNNLSPAEQRGTATYYLVKLIKISPQSPLISQARSRISKAHLALAKAANKNEEWGLAQQHLDDAFNVRLPDSYQ